MVCIFVLFFDALQFILVIIIGRRCRSLLRLGFLLVNSRHATISRRRHIATDKMIEGGELSYNFYARDKDNDQRKAHIHILKQTFYFKKNYFLAARSFNM